MTAAETCAHCGQGMPAGARFCPACGAAATDSPSADARKTVTLLFCDVNGSTAMGEQLDPEALRGAMGRYFAAASDAVERHGGTVEKFVGDAVLAVFGIPEVREDDALRAVRAADEMRSALAALSDELLVSMDVRLAVRTGVNTGSVVAGPSRAGGAFATGDAVNTAARLEQAAPPGEVLIGSSTLALVRDAVEVEAVEPLSVKGKAQPLEAYRLVRVLDTDRGRARRLDARLVGREREWRALSESLSRASEDGRSQLITVLGSAGVGKTRLVEQFLGHVDRDVRVLRGRCLSYGRGITFWPVLQLLRQAAGLTGEEEAEAAGDALLRLLAGCSEADAVVRRLRPLMGYDGEPGGTEETFWAVRSFFEHLATTAPLVVTIDDLHWAEPTLLDLIERIRDDARDVPLLIVCQARPELLEQRPSWGGGAFNALTFNLEPLTVAQTAALLEGLLGPGVPASVASVVDRWAGGNPLFVEEVVAHLVEAALLVRSADGWAMTGSLDSVQVPSSVTTLLAARLERLPADERSLVERISVVGLEVTTAEAMDLSPDLPDVSALLSSLARRDLLRRTRGMRPDTWAFRHVLVREAAYDALPKALRAELHERFADRLAKNSADAGGEVAAFVGHHLEQAARFRAELTPGSPAAQELAARAADTLSIAATEARDTDDLPAALGLVDRALALTPSAGPERQRLLWLKADLLHDQGLFSRLLEVLSEIRESPTSAAARESALLQAVELATRVHMSEDIDPTALTDAARTAMALCRAQDDAAGLVRALRSALVAEQIAGRWEAMRALLEEILRIGSPSDRRPARGMMVAVHQWGPTPAPTALGFITEQLDQPALTARDASMLRGARALMLALHGQLAEGLAEALAVSEGSRDLDPFARASVAFNLVEVHLANGDVETAIHLLDDAIGLMRTAGGLAYASTLLGWKAVLLLERPGQEEAARTVSDEADSVTSQYDNMSVGLVETCKAVLASRAGQDEPAAAHLDRALSAIDASDQDLQRADIRRWLSEIPARRGGVAAQRQLLEQALTLYRSKGHLPNAERTQQLLAELDE